MGKRLFTAGFFTEHFPYEIDERKELLSSGFFDIPSVHEYAGSGSIVFEGIAATTKTATYSYSGSGTISFSGSGLSEESNKYSYTGQGSIVFEGTAAAEEVNEYSAIGFGQIEFSGTATTELTGEHVYTGSGAVTFSGSPETEYSVIYEYSPSEQEFNSADAETGDLSQLDDTYIGSGNTIIANVGSKLHGSYGYDVAFGGSAGKAYIVKNIPSSLKSTGFYGRFYVLFPSGLYPYHDVGEGAEATPSPTFIGFYNNADSRFDLYYTMGIGLTDSGNQYIQFYKKVYWTGSGWYERGVAQYPIHNHLDENVCVEFRIDKDDHKIDLWVNKEHLAGETNAATDDFDTAEVRIGIVEEDGTPSNGEYFYLDDLIISSSRVGYYHNPYMEFGGVATTESTVNYSYTSSGQIDFLGEATTQGAAASFEYAGSGQVVFSGAASYELEIEYAGSGSIQFSGAAITESVIEYIYSGTSELQLLGTGVSEAFNYLYSFTPSGQIIFSGTGNYIASDYEYVYNAQGEIVFSGLTTTSLLSEPRDILYVVSNIKAQLNITASIKEQLNVSSKINEQLDVVSYIEGS